MRLVQIVGILWDIASLNQSSFETGHMPWPRAGVYDEILASSLQQLLWARWNCCVALRKRNMPLELGRDRVHTNVCQRALSN